MTKLSVVKQALGKSGTHHSSFSTPFILDGHFLRGSVGRDLKKGGCNKKSRLLLRDGGGGRWDVKGCTSNNYKRQLQNIHFSHVFNINLQEHLFDKRKNLTVTSPCQGVQHFLVNLLASSQKIVLQVK